MIHFHYYIILKHSVAHRSQCRNFDTVRFKDIPHHTMEDHTSVDGRTHETCTIDHPTSDTFMGKSNKIPSKLQIGSQYILKSNKCSITQNSGHVNILSIINRSRSQFGNQNVVDIRLVWSALHAKESDITTDSMK